MKKDEKEKTDVLTWWRVHKNLFSNLFELVKEKELTKLAAKKCDVRKKG